MANTSDTSPKPSHKSSQTESTEKKVLFPLKSQSKLTFSKTEPQYIFQARTWPTDTQSWEEILAKSQPNGSSTTSLSNQPSSSSLPPRFQATPMERWELETQQNSPWNGIEQFKHIGDRK